MDDVLKKLGSEALPLSEHRRLQKALKELKSKPLPPGESFADWEAGEGKGPRQR